MSRLLASAANRDSLSGMIMCLQEQTLTLRHTGEQTCGNKTQYHSCSPLLFLLLQVLLPLYVQNVIHVFHSKLHILVQAADFLWQKHTFSTHYHFKWWSSYQRWWRDLELFFSSRVQWFLVEQLEVVFVSVELALCSCLLRSSEALQQAGLQCADVPVKRLGSTIWVGQSCIHTTQNYYHIYGSWSTETDWYEILCYNTTLRNSWSTLVKGIILQ